MYSNTKCKNYFLGVKLTLGKSLAKSEQNDTNAGLLLALLSLNY